ncbi:MAG: hypothetical protein J7M40_19550 [Planctomycetes bacterium]|nr:hypothetical protein [Planctomycetota bacterium]
MHFPLIDAPDFQVNGQYQHGGQLYSQDTLDLDGPGVYYYTIDGTDPYDPGNPTAGVTPINLTKSALIRVRSYDSVADEWSALNEAAFSVGPNANNLRVTEIMYHPADPVQPSSYIDEDFEYIELQNTGSESINLNMVHFTDGIDYNFGDVGSLDNNGEEIVLRDAAGTEILDFDYSDGWFAITDGAGYSITTANANSTDPNDWDSKAGWRPSSQVDGTPGREDTGFTLVDGDIVISEILTHTDEMVYGDWIELHNTTGSDIYIGGWKLDLTMPGTPEPPDPMTGEIVVPKIRIDRITPRITLDNFGEML